MGAPDLARTEFRREALGYLAMPALYGALQAAGVFVPSPALLLLSLALVLMLLLQARSAGAAASTLPPTRRGGQPILVAPRPLEAADRAFVQQVNHTVVANALGFFLFLGALELHLRTLAAGATGATALLPGALLAIGVIIGGREAARIAAWRAVGDLASGSLPGLPLAGPSLRAYLEWRAGVGAE